MVQLMVSLDLYKGGDNYSFERRFIDKTAYFYQMQSRELLKKFEVSDYLRLVLHMI
jgi:hypothetical protein